jgi:hypothetical protein
MVYQVSPGMVRIDPVGGEAMRYFLCVIGMVMVIEGLPYFAWPDKMKTWLQRIAQTPDNDLRKIAAALMAFGLFLVYLGRP